MSQLKLFDRQLTLDDKGGGKVIPLHRGKIKVKAIIYSDAEGYRDEKAPYMNKPYTTWTQANQAASSMAWFASHGKDGSKGGSDKTNFRIEWVDGETYDGRIDIDYTMRLNGRPLTDHVTQFVRFIAGIGKPPHLSETDYRNYVNRLERDKPGQTQSAIDFLQKYDLGNEAAVAHGHKPAGKTEYEKSRDEREAEEAANEKRKKAALSKYPPPVTDRDEAIARIKAALQKRSGKMWSVTGGRGTAWGWIRITAPPKRLDGSVMSPADRAELKKLLGLEREPYQDESVAAGGDYRTEYVDRAEGRKPRVHGVPYWD